MANILRRADIIRVLTEAGIEFDPEATIVQLRPLYDEIMEQNARDSLFGVLNGNINREQMPEEQNANSVIGEGQRAQMVNMQHVQMTDANQCMQNRAEEDEIDRQIALLRKKQELIKLQRELGQTEANETRKMDFMSFEAMVHKFTGDDAYDIDKWLDDLEDAFTVLNCNDRDKFIAARRLMDGTAKIFIRTIRVNNYQDLKDELLAEFKHTYTLREVYQQLKERVWQPSRESLKRYVSIMVEIANRARVPETDLVDIIIDGLNDKSGYVSMLYGARSVRELKDALVRYERKLHDVMSVPSRTVAPLNTVVQTGTKPKQMRMPTEARANTNPSVGSNTSAGGNSIDMSTIRCYNCFQYGHYQSSCPAPKRPPGSCFICSEVGHMRHECPNRKPKPNTSDVQNTVASVENWDMDEDEAEVRSLAKQLASAVIDPKQNSR